VKNKKLVFDAESDRYTKRTKRMNLPVPIPEGSRIERNGKYLRIANCHCHPLASESGNIPYHRFVLYHSLGKPDVTPCHWCGYFLPWKTTQGHALGSVVNVDHLDADTNNNSPENLAASCWWCNANRIWAEKHPHFWQQWRKWMRDVPPVHRPNLRNIAADCRIRIEEWRERGTDEG
jgi:hypothetical protein